VSFERWVIAALLHRQWSIPNVGSHISMCQYGSSSMPVKGGQPVGVTTLSTTPQEVSACGTAPVDVLGRAEADRRAALLKALADPVRLQLLSIIGASPGREACVCDMTDAVQVSQPTVSHHLKTLVDAGILTRERRGSWAWFRLDDEQLAAVRGFLA
jgi:ArsR family transcriptional regulator, arsenate/arsenite/antimonite-responsive transcriptional repressor